MQIITTNNLAYKEKIYNYTSTKLLTVQKFKPTNYLMKFNATSITKRFMHSIGGKMPPSGGPSGSRPNNMSRPISPPKQTSANNININHQPSLKSTNTIKNTQVFPSIKTKPVKPINILENVLMNKSGFKENYRILSPDEKLGYVKTPWGTLNDPIDYVKHPHLQYSPINLMLYERALKTLFKKLKINPHAYPKKPKFLERLRQEDPRLKLLENAIPPQSLKIEKTLALEQATKELLSIAKKAQKTHVWLLPKAHLTLAEQNYFFNNFLLGNEYVLILNSAYVRYPAVFEDQLCSILIKMLYPPNPLTEIHFTKNVALAEGFRNHPLIKGLKEQFNCLKALKYLKFQISDPKKKFVKKSDFSSEIIQYDNSEIINFIYSKHENTLTLLIEMISAIIITESSSYLSLNKIKTNSMLSQNTLLLEAAGYSGIKYQENPDFLAIFFNPGKLLGCLIDGKSGAFFNNLFQYKRIVSTRSHSINELKNLWVTIEKKIIKLSVNASDLTTKHEILHFLKSARKTTLTFDIGSEMNNKLMSKYLLFFEKYNIECAILCPNIGLDKFENLAKSKFILDEAFIYDQYLNFEKNPTLGTLYHCISEIYLYHIKAVAHATIFP